MSSEDNLQRLAYNLTIAFLQSQKGSNTPKSFFEKYDEVYPEFLHLVVERYGPLREKKAPREDF